MVERKRRDGGSVPGDQDFLWGKMLVVAWDIPWVDSSEVLIRDVLSAHCSHSVGFCQGNKRGRLSSYPAVLYF